MATDPETTEDLNDILGSTEDAVFCAKRNREAAALNPGFDGMRAKDAGLPVDACPYDPSPQRTAWVVGWYIAERRNGVQPNAE